MPQGSNQIRCVNCGRAFPSQANYCPRCGRSVRDAAPPVVMATPLPPLRFDPRPEPPVQRPLPATPKKKGGGCGGCGCFLLLLAVVVGVGLYFRVSHSPDRRLKQAVPSPPADTRPPRAPDFRLPPVPLMGPMSGSWVSIRSVEADAMDPSGRVGYRLHGRVHAVRGARIVIAAYVQRSDGTAVPGTDPMYRDDERAAGVATTLTMPRDDIDFTLFLPRHVIALTSSAQPLWIRPCLFDGGSGYHFCNGTPVQFWSGAIRTPTR